MKNEYYKKIIKCRLCNSKIDKIISFPDVPLGNDLQSSKSKSKIIKKYPLKVYRCKKCFHIQLGVSVNPLILYQKNYTYLSGIGKNFLTHFDNYSDWIIKKLNLKKRDLILDIGSNDGTCLKFFKKKGMSVCGVDPAKKPAKISNDNGVKCINSFFNEKVVNKILKNLGRPKLVTSHNVLAHIDEIYSTFKLIYEILEIEGYFCFEIGYFVEVLKKNNFDTIYHEHLDYHTAYPLKIFLNKIGFSIKNISVNSIQGGSLRILAKKEKITNNSKQVLNFIKKEKKILNISLINNFKINLSKNIEHIKEYLLDAHKKNFKLIGYGAPTKATLYSKLLNIDSNLIPFTFEDNKLKINKYIPNTDIKIISFSKKRLNDSDIIFIFAWNFKSNIIDKIKFNLNKNKKLTIVIPNPYFSLVNL